MQLSDAEEERGRRKAGRDAFKTRTHTSESGGNEGNLVSMHLADEMDSQK